MVSVVKWWMNVFLDPLHLSQLMNLVPPHREHSLVNTRKGDSVNEVVFSVAGLSSPTLFGAISEPFVTTKSGVCLAFCSLCMVLYWFLYEFNIRTNSPDSFSFSTSVNPCISLDKHRNHQSHHVTSQTAQNKQKENLRPRTRHWRTTLAIWAAVNCIAFGVPVWILHWYRRHVHQIRWNCFLKLLCSNEGKKNLIKINKSNIIETIKTLFQWFNNYVPFNLWPNATIKKMISQIDMIKSWQTN